MESGIRIGKPANPKAVKDFFERQEKIADSAERTRKRVALAIIPLTAIFIAYSVYTNFFSENSSKAQVFIPDIETREQLENREIITPEFLISLSESGNSNKPSFTQEARSVEDIRFGANSRMQVLEPKGPGDGASLNSLTIPPGSVLEAHIDGQVDTSSFKTPVVAVVDHDFEYQGKVVVPKNSKLFGDTFGIQAGNRVMIRFDKLAFPNGYAQYRLYGIARDENDRVGVAGEVQRGNVYKAGTSFASTMLGIGAGSFIDAGDSVFNDIAGRTIQNTTQDLSLELSNNRSEQDAITVSLPAEVPIRVLVIEY